LTPTTFAKTVLKAQGGVGVEKELTSSSVLKEGEGEDGARDGLLFQDRQIGLALT